jgi:hypothetical protein
MSDLERSNIHKDKKQEQTMNEPSRPWAEWPEYKALKEGTRVVPHPGVTVRIFPNPRRNKVEKTEPEKK